MFRSLLCVLSSLACACGGESPRGDQDLGASIDLGVLASPDLVGVVADLSSSVPSPDLTGATATPISIANPSFESPATPADSFNVSGPPLGWSTYGAINNNNRSVGVLNPNTTQLYLDAVPDGSNVGVVFLMDDPNNQSVFSNSAAGLQQTLTETLAASSEYRLTVAVGNLNQVAAVNHPFAFAGFPGYRVELLAGGEVLASDESLTPGEGRFATSSVVFSTGMSHPQLGAPLGIRLINRNSAVGIEVNFDDVRLTRRPL